ncbi:MAG TPA: hypothetical protein VGJ37_18945 [Pyrinomonadaceae bacterium]
MKVKFLFLQLCLILGLGVWSLAQTPGPNQTSSVDEKSQKIIDQAIAALGGQAYLNVQTVIGKGFYSDFKEGTPQVPTRFTDYIGYPDRERTEFVSSGIRTIQTNAGETGWIFDGAVKKISEQGPAQVEEFKRSMRTTVENLLHGWWRNEGGKVTYVGRREAGLAKRNETIRLTYPNGFWIEYEFGAKDGMPAKIIYKRMRRDPDSGNQVETTEEDRLLTFVKVEDINAAWIIDHYVNDKQTSRINYESVQYNQKLADALFVKPDNVKSIK